jgi:uncharacterized DUF497 family protein
MKNASQLTFLFLLGLLSLACPVCAQETHKTLEDELINMLSTFANKHSLSFNEVQTMMGRIVLDSKFIRMGGVGIIEEDTYVFLDEKRNTLEVSGLRWEGKPSSKQEVVFIYGRHILNSLDKANLSKVTIVLFSPLEVRFISLSKASGGTYKRYPE